MESTQDSLSYSLPRPLRLQLLLTSPFTLPTGVRKRLGHLFGVMIYPFHFWAAHFGTWPFNFPIYAPFWWEQFINSCSEPCDSFLIHPSLEFISFYKKILWKFWQEVCLGTQAEARYAHKDAGINLWCVFTRKSRFLFSGVVWWLYFQFGRCIALINISSIS